MGNFSHSTDVEDVTINDCVYSYYEIQISMGAINRKARKIANFPCLRLILSRLSNQISIVTIDGNIAKKLGKAVKSKFSASSFVPGSNPRRHFLF
jgi:hypothetical protein